MRDPNGTLPSNAAEPHAVRRLMNKLGFLSPARVRPLRGAQSTPTFAAAQPYRSDSDSGSYVSLAERAARDFRVFETFKQHPDYTRILEHLTEPQGRAYLHAIRSDAPDLLARVEDFKVNDWIGSPARFEYEGIGLISPTTLRYIKVASDLRQFFGELKDFRLAEIGVGYGGQMLVLDRVTPSKMHELFDLPPVLALVSRYLESHLLEGAYRAQTLNTCSGIERYDLVFSNYAFSELPASVQRKYIEKVLSKSDRGYLTMNSGRDLTSKRSQGKLSIADLRQLLPPFQVFEAHPLRLKWTCIIVWGHEGLPPWAEQEGEIEV